MHFSEERLTPELILEIEPFLIAHAEEVNDHEPKVDWGKFQTLDAIRALRVYTIRLGDWNNKLIGYASFVLDDHPHYDVFVANNSAIYILPEHRGNKTALNFIAYCTAKLTKEKVQNIYMTVRPMCDYSQVLNHLGFKFEETIYSKRI